MAKMLKGQCQNEDGSGYVVLGCSVAQSVERSTPGEEVGGPGFDSRCGRPLPTGWVGVSIM